MVAATLLSMSLMAGVAAADTTTNTNTDDTSSTSDCTIYQTGSDSYNSCETMSTFSTTTHKTLVPVALPSTTTLPVATPSAAVQPMKTVRLSLSVQAVRRQLLLRQLQQHLVQVEEEAQLHLQQLLHLPPHKSLRQSVLSVRDSVEALGFQALLSLV
jgi:hypothetical protein